MEKLGVKEVRKLLSMGVYAKHKIPVIEEWLRRKEAEIKRNNDPHLNMPSTESITRFDRFISYAKNHPVISVILIIGLGVIVLANFTNAVSQLTKYLPLPQYLQKISK